MTLTTVIGSSGSGKTTFLNDVHRNHKCIYIRQYHNMRPYIAVSRIPNFDPTRLPYWNIYINERKADSIKVGGSMGHKFTAGLSGGQRKLLLFELISQRVKTQSDLLIVLDEPFAGVTDDFVPFIVERLNEMRKMHNILLVTNDHVETLTTIADNTITVSAIDRTNVRINNREKVNRDKAISALSIGDGYTSGPSGEALKFFFDVEVRGNGSLVSIAIFTIFAHLMILISFWDSYESSSALVFTGALLISYFCINPYLISLVEWRNAMREEAEALVHSSKGMYIFLKICLTLTLMVLVSLMDYGFVIAVADDVQGFDFWAAIFLQSLSAQFPLVALGILSNLPFELVHIFGTLPFLFTIFLSTTFSPGAGLPVIKELRYLFPRFYLWCMLPVVQDNMEGCPREDKNMLYMFLSALLFVIPFLLMYFLDKIFKSKKGKAAKAKRADMLDEEFVELQVEMFGEKIRRQQQHMNDPAISQNDTSSCSSGHIENEFERIDL